MEALRDVCLCRAEIGLRGELQRSYVGSWICNVQLVCCDQCVAGRGLWLVQLEGDFRDSAYRGSHYYIAAEFSTSLEITACNQVRFVLASFPSPIGVLFRNVQLSRFLFLSFSSSLPSFPSVHSFPSAYSSATCSQQYLQFFFILLSPTFLLLTSSSHPTLPYPSLSYICPLISSSPPSFSSVPSFPLAHSSAICSQQYL